MTYYVWRSGSALPGAYGSFTTRADAEQHLHAYLSGEHDTDVVYSLLMMTGAGMITLKERRLIEVEGVV